MTDTTTPRDIPIVDLADSLPFHNSESIPNSSSIFTSQISIGMSLDNLEQMCFNPLDLNESEQNHIYTEDNEYEISHWNTINSHQSNYFTESSFTSHLSTTENNNSLSFLHLNTRSLFKHIDEITSFIHNLHIKFSVLAFSETWLNSTSEPLVNLDGYKQFLSSRKSKKGGGLALYINDNYQNCKLRSDLSGISPNGECESLFIELEVNGSNYLIGVFYRPPGTDINSFNHYFNCILETIQKENKKCVILGDFNIDLFKCDRHGPSKSFLELLKSYYFFPKILKPTRIQAHSATLIDNIFTNYHHDQSLSGIFLTDITDHFPIFHLIKQNSSYNEPLPQTKRRKITDQAKFEFSCKVEQTDWNFVNRESDVDEALRVFMDKFTCIYDECFPTITFNSKRHKIIKPWTTYGILNSVYEKNRLYRKQLKSKSESDRHNYRQYRNKLNHIIRQARKKYFENSFNRYNNNIKNTWKTLNQLMGRKKSQSLPCTFSLDGINESNPKTIANAFNEHFSTVAIKLDASIPDMGNYFKSYLSPANSINFQFPTITTNDIRSIIKDLNSSAAAGLDGILSSVVKLVSSSISSPLSHIINLSLLSGKVPQQLKQAKISPIHKSDDSQDIKNYRPISLLNYFSKILEKVVANTITTFLNDCDIINPYQYGFRANHSTTLAACNLYEKLIEAKESGLFSVLSFLDLSKAFDTVNYNILFHKLSHYGLRGVANDWFRSYLFERSQSTSFNGILSSPSLIKSGVPQGSILGPLLFLIYINDISNVSNLIHTILFADDTSLLISGNDPRFCIDIMSQELEKIQDWLFSNRLSLNISKTKYMIIKPIRRMKLRTLPQLKYMGHPLIAFLNLSSGHFL